MFSHTGADRTFGHNIRLAGILSLTAGMVNVTGFLAFTVLTTNVTGHVASFAEKLMLKDFSAALKIGMWMLMFLLGAFFSSLFIGKAGRNIRFAYAIPFLAEVIILLFIGFYNDRISDTAANFFAGGLLFAMGIQNATVSMISGSVVRTTHLTGMFTDLGIELAEKLQKRYTEELVVRQKIRLRLVIILFFFTGGIAAAFLFPFMKFKTFYVPAALLVFAMFFDMFRASIVHAWNDRKK
jgi:uncharacterized membrane protein YoaK (UPF0700 family)